MNSMNGEGSSTDEYVFQHAVVEEPAQLTEDATCINDCANNLHSLVCFVFTPMWPYLGVVLSLACGGVGTTCVTTGEVYFLHPLFAESNASKHMLRRLTSWMFFVQGV